MTWNLGTTNQEHLDEHNLFDHAGIATPTPGKILGVSGGKYTQVDAGTGDHDTLINVSPDDHHAENHQARHQAAGADPLSGSVNANARVVVAKNGTPVGTRRRVNLIEGTNITLTLADDAGNEEVDVTVAVDSTARRITSTGTMLADDGVIIVNSNGGAVTVNLLALSTVNLRSVLVKRVGSNNVTIDASGSEVITTDGASQATKVLASNGAQWSGVASVSDAGWLTIGESGTVT